MNRRAQVTSVDALREFQTELRRFQEVVQSICEALGLETHRAQEWIESDRARYWPHAWRLAENRLVAAQSDLQLAKMAAMRDEHKSCIDEKKAVDCAKQRQDLCESKIRQVKHWRIKMRHQTEEFHGKLARLQHYADVDIPRALAALDRILRALDKYTETHMRASSIGRVVLAEEAPAESAAPHERLEQDEHL